MTGLLRKAMITGCLGVLAASSALAAVPNAGTSSIPGGITVVGRNASTAPLGDPKGTFNVTVRDVGSNVIPGSNVVVDFTACTDTRICAAQVATGVTADCSSNPGTVSAVTNGSGVATLTITGGDKNVGGLINNGVGFKCGVIYADGVSLGQVTVAVADENGSGFSGAAACNVTDVALTLNDSLHGFPDGRSDFNFSNTVNVTDASLLLTISLTAKSSLGCSGLFCH